MSDVWGIEGRKAAQVSVVPPTGRTADDLQELATEYDTAIDSASGATSTHAALTTAHGSTALNTASSIVQRDASGNFAAGTITANLTGTASGNDVVGAAAAVQTNLTTHINNATGAHAASAISVTPSGNLAATTVAAALTEHQGDIDTINSTIASLPVSQGGSGGTSGSPATIDGVANAGGDINLIQGTATIITPDNGVAKSITIGVDATATSTANKVPIGDSGGQLKGEWAGTGTPTTASMLFGGGTGTAPAWATISAKTEATTGASTDRLLIEQGGAIKSIQLGNISGLAGSGATVTGTGAIPYTVRTADIQLTDTTGAALDCTTDALVATLPVSPTASDLAAVMRYAGSTCRSYVKPAALGANILGAPQLITLGTAGEMVTLQWIDSTMGWAMSRAGAASLTCPVPAGTLFIMLPNGTWTQSGGTVSSVKDHSGLGNNATESTNKPAYSATGINSGPALDFNGTTNLLATASALLTSSSAFWFAFTYIADTVDATPRSLISQDSRVTGPHRCFVTSISSTDTGFTVFDQSAGGNIRIAGSVPTPGTKYTLVGTYDGGSVDTGLQLYINNSAASSRATVGTFVAPDDFTEPFRIGANYGSGALERFFDGKMNWCIFGTGTVTAAQISAWYTFGNSL